MRSQPTRSRARFSLLIVENLDELLGHLPEMLQAALRVGGDSRLHQDKLGETCHRTDHVAEIVTKLFVMQSKIRDGVQLRTDGPSGVLDVTKKLRSVFAEFLHARLQSGGDSDDIAGEFTE